MSSSVEWPEGMEMPATTAHLEAVGAFALFYNRLELALYNFIKAYLPGKVNASMQLYATLHNKGRLDLIRALITDERRDGVADAINHALKCFELCQENRNLLLHGAPTDWDEEFFTIIKAASSDPTTLKPYRFSLDDIRKTAISTERVWRYHVSLAAWLRYHAENPERGIPLPDKPPLPRKLSLSQLEGVR